LALFFSPFALRPCGSQVVTAAKTKNDDEKQAGANREDRLKDFLTQDKDVEKLLIKIRKDDSEREKREDKQRQWEQTWKLSAKTVLLPDSIVRNRPFPLPELSHCRPTYPH
jgi:hypothetical protein